MKTKTNPPIPSRTASSDDIGRRAYDLWEQSGSPHGRADEFWLQAERELSGAAVTSTPRRGFSAAAVRDSESLSKKTDQLLHDTGEVDNRSPTALNLDRS